MTSHEFGPFLRIVLPLRVGVNAVGTLEDADWRLVLVSSPASQPAPTVSLRPVGGSRFRPKGGCYHSSASLPSVPAVRGNDSRYSMPEIEYLCVCLRLRDVLSGNSD